jgi:hypothetical protein
LLVTIVTLSVSTDIVIVLFPVRLERFKGWRSERVFCKFFMIWCPLLLLISYRLTFILKVSANL